MFVITCSSLRITNILLVISYVTWYCLIKFMREIMLIISSYINQKYPFYLVTVALWATARIPPFTYTVIFCPSLVIFSTRSKLQNISIVEHLYNNMALMISNLISLVWLFLKKKLDPFSYVWSNIIFLFGITPVVWYNPWNQYVSSNWKFDFSLPSLFILDILLLLVDLIDLINLDFPSSICLLLILLFFF